jgi:hypothetical protein
MCSKKYSQFDITEWGVQKLPRWMRGKNKRVANMTPIKVRILGKHGPVRARFAVSSDLEQLDFEDQGGVCWDDRREATGTISLQMLQYASCMLFS